MKELGLRIVSERTHDNWHDFNVWMGNACKAPGDPVHGEVRALMESRIENDTSGFHPRRNDQIPSGLEFMHTVVVLIAETPVLTSPPLLWKRAICARRSPRLRARLERRSAIKQR